MRRVSRGAAMLCVAAAAAASTPATRASPPADEQVVVWRAGQPRAIVDARAARSAALFVFDIGDHWVPELFRGSTGAGGPHDYEARFRALANEAFPEDEEGRRAREDRFLEVYGIPPSLGVLRARFFDVRANRCRRRLGVTALHRFRGADLDADAAEAIADELTHDSVFRAALLEIQERLACDGHLEGAPTGRFDPPTRRALAEFERRHRIYARSRLDGETLEALKTDPLELERRALVRVLTERVLLSVGIVEDGSGDERDLEAEVRREVEAAFGLESVYGALDFLHAVGTLDGNRLVAIPAVSLPEHHRHPMRLHVEIDRGDVWYDVPLDERGRRQTQPIEHGPVLTLFARRAGADVALARYGTTIGGWRVLEENGEKVLRYMESPVGKRVWAHVVAAPVWLPPPDYPSDSLLVRSNGEPVLNRNLVGPSYASAYGLVAAYHRRLSRDGEGVALGPDEGIRTHGSSDYTSVWKTDSLGCHRLRNHLAIRLFGFVLAHHPHRRRGHHPLGYERQVVTGGFDGRVRLHRSGYVFELTPPLPVRVLEGRIRGARRSAPTDALPVSTGAEAL